MGKLIVMSAPSGGGKNTIVDQLIERLPNAARAVTTTTREIREREAEGVDYFFISKEEFLERKEGNAFVETNEYVGNFYGLEKQVLTDFTAKYDYVFATIDVHGKDSLDKLDIDHISIFVLPEDFEVLKERITGRSEISEEELKGRIEEAENEMKKAKEYDFQIVNKQGKLGETVDKIVDYLLNNE